MTGVFVWITTMHVFVLVGEAVFFVKKHRRRRLRRALRRLGTLGPVPPGMSRRNPAYNGFMRALELR